MKRMLILFLFFVLAKADAQNEFAATAFYTDFQKIYEDAKAGFIITRGANQHTGFEGLSTEYLANQLLPLADSGKVVVPVSTGNPYVIYYFEPDKVRLKVDQRGVNLRDAVVTAFGKPLYSRTETTIINNYPFTQTLYFAEPEESNSSGALFRQCIYFQDGKYYLSFEIKGKKAAATD
ncbi:MAG: hypothetical protein ABI688_09865 [Bacteroidota bacterium]